mmetsp:Transcript_26735/g.27094  ORF Transcript_26735/g.27094 Transcript_26735/m.27094 type:complete len:81 (+) Transcript_26735:44-286(+)
MVDIQTNIIGEYSPETIVTQGEHLRIGEPWGKCVVNRILGKGELNNPSSFPTATPKRIVLIYIVSPFPSLSRKGKYHTFF